MPKTPSFAHASQSPLFAPVQAFFSLYSLYIHNSPLSFDDIQKMARALTLLAVLVGLLSTAAYFLEQHLEAFYVFDRAHLHDLSRRALAAHGNDTRAVVRHIVDELHARPATAAYVNLDEEWVFNNAGGAMGAMYLIHASMFFGFPPSSAAPLPS